MSFNIEEIQDQFNQVLRYSQHLENEEVQTNVLFDNWLRNKQKFISNMGGNLIYEFPTSISFSLSETERHNRVMRFVDYVKRFYGTADLDAFVLRQEEGFFKNLTVLDYTTPEGKLIKKGSKIVKDFKYFVKDPSLLTEIQNEASRIIQEDKIEGTLCVSVHPLDYLSSSETTYNWRSCHALDGEYRAGNLSYMQDESTVVCYLKGENKVKLPNFPDGVSWNSKKWRVLIFFSNDNNLIFAGRQYPFDAGAGINTLLRTILSSSGLISEKDASYSNWTEVISETVLDGQRIRLDPPVVPIGHHLKEIQDVIEDIPKEDANHYNDLLYSSCYTPRFSMAFGKTSRAPLTTRYYTKVRIGNKVPCIKCGKYGVMSGGSTMMCDDCELRYGTESNDVFTNCVCCGRRLYTDDAYFVDYETYCSDCYNNNFQQCDCCGNDCRIEDIIYDEETGEELCPDCYEARQTSENVD